MRKTLTNAWAFILIYLCLYAGIFLSALLPITIPGSIMLLSFQLVPPLWLKPGCYVLICYMALLFVPIVVSCAVSTLMVMVVVGLSFHYVHRERPIAGQAQDVGDR